MCENWDSDSLAELVIELDVPDVKNIDNLLHLLHAEGQFCRKLEELPSISHCSLQPRSEKTFYEFEVNLRLGANVIGTQGDFEIKNHSETRTFEVNTSILFGFLKTSKFPTVLVFDAHRNKVLINIQLPSALVNVYQAIGEKRISNRLSNELSNALYHFKN